MGTGSKRQDTPTTVPAWDIQRLLREQAEMAELLRLMARGIGQPFDHPDRRALDKAGDTARALLSRIEGE